MFKTTLEGLDNGDVLTVKEVKTLGQHGNVNKVTVNGNKIIQESDDGRNLVGVVLSADNADILDPSEIVYALNSTGDLGMTSPETIEGEQVSYAIYLKYKNGGYDASDIKTNRTYNRKLIVPGKGSVDLTFTLKPVEYKA